MLMGGREQFGQPGKEVATSRVGATLMGLLRSARGIPYEEQHKRVELSLGQECF
jgi:hypothetical protein